jgi:hypothetical protein
MGACLRTLKAFQIKSTTAVDNVDGMFFNGISYQQCGSAWFQPQFSGSSITSVVVNAPSRVRSVNGAETNVHHREPGTTP